MDLTEAFRLQAGSIVAAVGGGGKTSLVFTLAHEATKREQWALVTTTTKIVLPTLDWSPRMVAAGERSFGSILSDVQSAGGATLVYTGRGSRNRLLGFDTECFPADGPMNHGVILIEADGSAHRPFKAPAEHEPAIPPAATDVVVCTGLDALGTTLNPDDVHRPEIVAELGRAKLGDPVTPDLIVRVMLHPEGGRKHVPAGARVHALLNAPRTRDHERLGIHIAERLVYGGFHTAVVGTAHRPGDIRAVVR